MTQPSAQPEPTTSPQPVLIARDWLTAVILLLVMTLLWIGFGVYRALTAVDIPEPLRSLTAPVKTEIDTGILEELSARQQLRNLELSETDRVRLETPSDFPQSAPASFDEASPSAQP